MCDQALPAACDTKKVEVSWGKPPSHSEGLVGAPRYRDLHVDLRHEPELQMMYSSDHFAGWDKVDGIKDTYGPSIAFSDCLSVASQQVKTEVAKTGLAGLGKGIAALGIAAIPVVGRILARGDGAGASAASAAASALAAATAMPMQQMLQPDDLFIKFQLQDHDLHELTPMKTKYFMERELMPLMNTYGGGNDGDLTRAKLESLVTARQQEFKTLALTRLTSTRHGAKSFMSKLIPERCSWTFDSDPMKDTLYMKLVFDLEYEEGKAFLDEILRDVADAMQIPRACLHAVATKSGSLEIFFQLAGVALIILAVLTGVAFCIGAYMHGCCLHAVTVNLAFHAARALG